MTSRRAFLQLSVQLAAAGCILRRPAYAAAPAAMTYGVQMFMVRALAEKDLAAAFKSIKGAGFDQVELYPIAYHQPAAQLKRLLNDTGLSAISGHFDYTGREQSVEYAHQLGLKYLICPMMPEDQKLSLDGFHRAAEWFSQWGQSAKSAGIQFAFHNHDYEFKPIAGSNGWTVLMKGTDPSLMKLEFDVFWLLTAGQDPFEMMKRHADRFVLLHMKDRIAGAPPSFVVDEKAVSYCTELGKGTIPWPRIIEQARSQGVQYAYLDQDTTTIPVEQSMRESRGYLSRLKG